MKAVVYDRYGPPEVIHVALEDVADAARYIDTHQKTGNVVLTLA
jgi:hypothetical protein